MNAFSAVDKKNEIYTPSPELLKNKVILITGASRGIGAAVAKAYARHGATVILLARTIQALKTVYDDIEKNYGATPAIFPMNLAKATFDDYQTLTESITTNFGKLDGILLNAATLGSLTPIEQYPLDQWYDVLQVNFNSQFLLIQSLLPLLKQGIDPSIIFSLLPPGESSKAYWGPYAMAKEASQSLMRVLADELEQHSKIRVNGIAPRGINTHLRNQAYPAENKALLKMPEAITANYLYLMGNDSRTIHGQILNV